YRQAGLAGRLCRSEDFFPVERFTEDCPPGRNSFSHPVNLPYPDERMEISGIDEPWRRTRVRIDLARDAEINRGGSSRPVVEEDVSDDDIVRAFAVKGKLFVVRGICCGNAARRNRVQA